MNGRLELRIITQPYSEVDWVYFRRLVFGNSLTKRNKLSSFSSSVVILFLPLSHIPPCYHAKTPDFPRLIGPRESVTHNNNYKICPPNMYYSKNSHSEHKKGTIHHMTSITPIQSS